MYNVYLVFNLYSMLGVHYATYHYVIHYSYNVYIHIYIYIYIYIILIVLIVFIREYIAIHHLL